jgi:hypothetical protein
MRRPLFIQSPPYSPGASGVMLAPFAAHLRCERPIGFRQRTAEGGEVGTLVVDVETAAAFTVERLDELSTADLRALGQETLGEAGPDGRRPELRALRITFRRNSGGAFATKPRPFRANVFLEPDLPGLENQLRGVAADGFRESREQAAGIAAGRVYSGLGPKCPAPAPGSAEAAALELLAEADKPPAGKAN